MTVPDLFTAYRRMFACPDDEMVAWWYCGSGFAKVPDYPEMLVINVETVMVYRTETLDADRFAIHWWEIGYFRDALTGEIASDWLNPVTGKRVSTPKVLEEGPARVVVSRDGDGVKVDIEQHLAVMRGVDVSWKVDRGRVFINQEERKARGLPRPDGTLPPPGSPDVAEGITNLSIYADLADVQSSANVYPCSGSYTFSLDAPAPWMGFDGREGFNIVRGRMDKVPLDEVINPGAWSRLQQLLPHAFNGQRLKPKWTR